MFFLFVPPLSLFSPVWVDQMNIPCHRTWLKKQSRPFLCCALCLSAMLVFFFLGYRDVWVPLAAPKNPTRAHHSKTSQVRVSGNERGTDCFLSGLSYATYSRSICCSSAMAETGADNGSFLSPWLCAVVYPRSQFCLWTRQVGGSHNPTTHALLHP